MYTLDPHLNLDPLGDIPLPCRSLISLQYVGLEMQAGYYYGTLEPP
jgi:hypothetical protein